MINCVEVLDTEARKEISFKKQFFFNCSGCSNTEADCKSRSCTNFNVKHQISICMKPSIETSTDKVQDKSKLWRVLQTKVEF